MIEFNDKLEEQRSQLLGTKQKSAFADEEKLREKITDVYSAVASQEAPPSNLQVQRAEALQKEPRQCSEPHRLSRRSRRPRAPREKPGHEGGFYWPWQPRTSGCHSNE